MREFDDKVNLAGVKGLGEIGNALQIRIEDFFGEIVSGRMRRHREVALAAVAIQEM